MNNQEKREIVEAFRYEFQTFKTDVVDPLIASVATINDRTIDQGNDIASQGTAIKTVTRESAENRAANMRTLVLLISSLVAVLATAIAVIFKG